jgi:transposase
LAGETTPRGRRAARWAIWRTLHGLAEFAVVQSYLSTAAKWGIDKLDALTQLFTAGPWLPPATSPAQ